MCNHHKVAFHQLVMQLYEKSLEDCAAGTPAPPVKKTLVLALPEQLFLANSI